MSSPSSGAPDETYEMLWGCRYCDTPRAWPEPQLSLAGNGLVCDSLLLAP